MGAWTSKQAIVTKSSTEAELVALTDAGVNAIWMRHFLIAQGVRPFSVVIFQDNTSVLDLMKNGGAGPSQRTNKACGYSVLVGSSEGEGRGGGSSAQRNW